jgi:hypothetical protein
MQRRTGKQPHPAMRQIERETARRIRDSRGTDETRETRRRIRGFRDGDHHLGQRRRIVRMTQEALLPQQVRCQVLHQIDPALRLIRQLNERETGAGAGRVRFVDRALQPADRWTIDARAAQPGKCGLRVIHRECQNVNAGIAREETIQCGTPGIRIDHRQQLDIGPMQHGASVADPAVRLAGKRRQREAEALVLAGKCFEIARDDADMIERHTAHGVFS